MASGSFTASGTLNAGVSAPMNVLDQRRSCKVPSAQNLSATPDPESVLIVDRGHIRRRLFGGWAGVLLSTDALDCIVRREGKLLIAIVVEPWQAAEFWGRA